MNTHDQGGTYEYNRDRKSLKKFKDYYRTQKPDPRNYALVVLGLNTALRISDILNLTYDMVYHKGEVRTHIVVKERKTGKSNHILLNQEIRKALKSYHSYLISSSSHRVGNIYLFPSPRNKDRHLSRYQAYRIFQAITQAVPIEGHISCHSLRKTFGYHAWKQGADPVVIMLIYNHSSFSITKRYLCIEQDDKDDIYRKILL
ncbi:MAG: tyrosine-type recombinase/integrase [Roseburia sp.]|nr:tyrosine-type recombinase/integrase [Roseburia sp.]